MHALGFRTVLEPSRCLVERLRHAYGTARRAATPASQSTPAAVHSATYTPPSQSQRSSVAGWSQTMSTLIAMTTGGRNAAQASALATSPASRLAQ
jgi:hypothetical protein